MVRLHPKPYAEPIPAGRAIRGLPLEDCYSFHKGSLAEKWWRQCAPGDSFQKVHPKKHWFNQDKASPHKPFSTLTKVVFVNGGAGTTHWQTPGQLSIAMCKRAQTLPDDFILRGTFQEQWARIGNSVPPMLMKSIAGHIKKVLLGGKESPTVISTFAGCGGSSLGYHWAGFQELLAVEWDDHAVATFQENFPGVPVYHGDIGALSVEECLTLAGIGPGELDVFDGSPPCQGFSQAGKRNHDDPRNQLFEEFVRLLAGIQPRVFVMENVAGLVRGHMKQVFLEIMASLRGTGYHVEAQVLNAKYYEVPQCRKRVIFVGVREDIYGGLTDA
tara:strand:- start:3563 stop:4549 length:987 start_codon:yes stop_codon:yes gene_type:complete